jgi:predicted PurR-regulated permease PerM
MINDRFLRVLIWLLIVAASIFLLERLFVLLALFATPLLLFGLAWLIALALRPLVDWMSNLTVPLPQRSRTSSAPATLTLNMPRSLAVLLVYLSLLAILVAVVLLLIPVVGTQLVTLQDSLPSGVDQIVQWSNGFENEMRRRGFRTGTEPLIRPEALTEQVANIGSSLVQQSVTIVGGIAVLLINLLLVLILSFYMTLDGPRLASRSLDLLPETWHDEVQELFEIVDRTFGGFLRAQLVQALVYGLATALLMLALGLTDIALASFLATILVLIPLIGGVFAVIPPLVIALIQAPNQFLPMLIGLMIIQQALFNIIMPRIMGRIVGLHPLLVFAAILVGATIAGGWGILFGIPIAGVIASVMQFVHMRSMANRASAIVK